MGIRPGASRRDPSAAGRRARFGYWFDNHLASGTRTLINLLGVGTIALVALAAIVIRVGRRTTSDTSSLLEGFWSSLLRSLDPGTMGSDNGWPYRVVSLSVTIGGILIVSALIGLVATGLDQLTALRRGAP